MDFNQMGGAGPARVTPDVIKNAKVFTCECGGKIFGEKLILKKISAILSPTGKEEFFPMHIIVCESCMLMPKELDTQNMVPKEFLTDK